MRLHISIADELVDELYSLPAGFNPATASAAEDAEYGIPNGGADLTESEVLDGVSFPTPPAFLAEIDASASSADSSVWTGFAVLGSAGTYTSAYSVYVEPKFDVSACSASAAEVTWAGIGGWSETDPLGQAGTAFNVGDMSNHQAWDELFPLTSIIPLDLTASPDDIMSTETDWGHQSV